MALASLQSSAAFDSRYCEYGASAQVSRSSAAADAPDGGADCTSSRRASGAMRPILPAHLHARYYEVRNRAVRALFPDVCRISAVGTLGTLGAVGAVDAVAVLDAVLHRNLVRPRAATQQVADSLRVAAALRCDARCRLELRVDLRRIRAARASACRRQQQAQRLD
eukprot:1769848-Prymnesium_polylepis.2